MKGYWDNLRPAEKRLVVIVGIVVFVLANLWFVVPHFSDWGKVKERTAKSQRTLELFERTVAQKPTYERMVRELEGEGQNVPAEEQSIHFETAVNTVAGQSGVMIQSKSRASTSTNQFFLELSETITVLAKEQDLVNFLYNLGSSNSLIRARDLTLNPDPPRQQLMATIKLVGSYQKKAAAKAGKPATTPTTTPGSKATPPRAATNTPSGIKQSGPGSGLKPATPSGVPQKSAPATGAPPSGATPSRPAAPPARPILPGGRTFGGTNKPGFFNSKRS